MSDDIHSNDELEKKLEATRQKKIENFKLNIDDIDDDSDDDIIFPDDDSDLIDEFFDDADDDIPSRSSEENEKKAEKEEEKRRKKALKSERRRKKKKAKKNGCVFRVVWLVLVLILGIFTAQFLLVGINDLLGRNRGEEQKIIIRVPDNNTSVDEMARILETSGIISNEKYFKLYMKVTKGNDIVFAKGSYEMKNNMDYEAIINYLQSNANRVDSVSIRFTEGMTILEIADKLEQNNVCKKDEFLDLCNSDKFDEDFTFLKEGRKNVDKTYYKLEGYLFPDTYDFYQGEDPTNTIYRFLNNYESKMYYTKQRIEIKDSDTDEDAQPQPKLDEYGNVMYDENGEVIYDTDSDNTKKKTRKYESLTIEEQAKKQGMTMDEVLILASMIQSEAASTEDMYKVSSVFHNRLDTLKTDGYSKYDEYIRGTLGSDPTIYYPYKQNTMPANFDSTYDTYKHPGLPAGPVCCPGLDAIRAALYPEDSDNYYFCHKPATEDSEAKAFYAKTNDEHQYNLAQAGLNKD